ncbi:MAG: hypothetical protein AMXMBFR59_29940 [Rhodanobacteraceae bacterium]
MPASESVFQGGPLHSPDGRQLPFAQVDGERSGDLFLVDPEKNADTAWLPRCRADRSAAAMAAGMSGFSAGLRVSGEGKRQCAARCPETCHAFDPPRQRRIAADPVCGDRPRPRG